jgi:hypothetical protein
MQGGGACAVLVLLPVLPGPGAPEEDAGRGRLRRPRPPCVSITAFDWEKPLSQVRYFYPFKTHRLEPAHHSEPY